jgi:acyl carrier protein
MVELHRHRAAAWSELLEVHVAAQVAKVLQLDASEVPTAARLFDLGLDSLTAVELKNNLATSLGCSLRSTLAFDYPTVASLSAHLYQIVSKDELNLHSDSDEMAGMLETVKQLSDEQIEQLVEQELNALAQGGGE